MNKELSYSTVVTLIREKRAVQGITLDPRKYLPVIRQELKLKRLGEENPK